MVATTMATHTPFGARLKAMREARGLTLARLAEASGLHLQSLARIESGGRPNPTWETVVALSRGLGVTPNEFLGDDDQAATDQPDDDGPDRDDVGKRK